MKKLGLLILLLVTVLLSAGIVQAPTKIVPTDGAGPGHPFTIVDTPEGRLVDGTKAVFKKDGSETLADLRTHSPYKTAKGSLPESLSGGSYTVYFKVPSGDEFFVGPFTVTDEPVMEPSIEPSEGLRGTAFTITDPYGRIAPGSVALFYKLGQDPQIEGINADGIIISPDGTTLSGYVPGAALSGENHIWVSPTPADTYYFDPVSFSVID